MSKSQGKKKATTKAISKKERPINRGGHAGVVISKDPIQSFIVGGWTLDQILDDVWCFNTSINDWVQLKSSPKSKISPFPRIEFDIGICDETLYLFGGMLIDEDSVSIYNDLWAFDLKSCSWRLLFEESPCSERYCHAICSVPSGFVVFGGICNQCLNDLWYYRVADNSWTQVPINQGEWPCERSCHSLVYDYCSGTVVLFGGTRKVEGESEFLNDLWTLNISNASTDKWQWNCVNCIGIAPSPREMASLLVLPNSQLVIFGGLGLIDSSCVDNADDEDEIVPQVERIEISEEINTEKINNSVLSDNSSCCSSTIAVSSSGEIQNVDSNANDGLDVIVQDSIESEVENPEIDEESEESNDDIEIATLSDIWIIDLGEHKGQCEEVDCELLELNDLKPRRGGKWVLMSDYRGFLFGGSHDNSPLGVSKPLDFNTLVPSMSK